MRHKLIHIISILIFSTNAFSQSNMSLKVSGLGYNFSTDNTSLYTNILANNVNLPLELGLVFNYDYFISDDKLSLSFQQIVFFDRASKITGLTGFSFRRKLFSYYKHSMNIALGASLYYRESWTDLPNYTNIENLLSSGIFEYKPFSITGGIEYAYLLNKKTDFIISLNYFQFKTINLEFGLRYWINKKIRNNRKCISCPTFH